MRADPVRNSWNDEIGDERRIDVPRGDDDKICIVCNCSYLRIDPCRSRSFHQLEGDDLPRICRKVADLILSFHDLTIRDMSFYIGRVKSDGEDISFHFEDFFHHREHICHISERCKQGSHQQIAHLM